MVWSTCIPKSVQLISWSIGKFAACDLAVVNPLNPSLILGASSTVGYSAAEKEVVKMTKNGPKCTKLGWECIPQKLSIVPAEGWQWAQPPVKPG